MVRALILVSLVGALLGFVLPGPRPAAPVAEDIARVERPAAKRPQRRPSPGETRIRREPDGHFYVDAEVNGQEIRFLVDTGASAVALTEADARRVGASFSPSEYEVVGTGASGAVRGQPISLDRIELDGKEVSDVRGAVVEGLHVSLLGQTFLSHMEMVQMSGPEMIIR